MMAYSSTMQAAKRAAAYRTDAMPFSSRSSFTMPAACMGMTAATGTMILGIGTGVLTSVSLFILVLSVLSLLVSLVVLISLLLTCLTGLVGLESLVGLTKMLATSTVQGD
ncbi:hypothetical protein KSF_059190 [Reticulibacter mediterranei]|uniref:Uncharacterized protein n=1 Tax=Reticulibacter mediterranei TaxID=2778369 RepID=A0A8J3IV79_9CHLR|nr:hypothetical protein KSF_059190 [Reticulibacter mediterranei]